MIAFPGMKKTTGYARRTADEFVQKNGKLHLQANRRRAFLIRKKHTEGLQKGEQKELTRLQKAARKQANLVAPLPPKPLVEPSCHDLERQDYENLSREN